MKAYKTVEKQGSAEFIERRSRFIGTTCPVRTEMQATDFIAKIKSVQLQATHNCWAYMLRENTTQRYSDDGEPQGTAGIPILEILRKEEVFDTVIVVTRYFGGVQLGTGGLIRAYSRGAKIALDAGNQINMAPCFLLSINLNYSLYDRFLSVTESYPMELVDIQYGENIKLEIRIRSDYIEQITLALTELSAGTILPTIIGEEFANI